MGSVEKLTKPGHYLAMFHDDGRFFKRKENEQIQPFSLCFKLFQGRRFKLDLSQDIMQRSYIDL